MCLLLLQHLRLPRLRVLLKASSAGLRLIHPVPPATKRPSVEASNEEPIDARPISCAPPTSRAPEASATPPAAPLQENTDRRLVFFTPPSKASASAFATPIVATPPSPIPQVTLEAEEMDEDVDIGDMGTHRVVDEAYELEHFISPSHTVFSLEPRSPSVTVVLSDTSQHSEDSVDASTPPRAEATEPEATSARTADPESFAQDTQHAETDRAASGPQPMDVAGRAEAEASTNAQPEAENSTNAQPEASKDGSEDKQATSPRLPKAS